MQYLSLFLPVLLLASITTSAQATSRADINELMELIKSTGTEFVHKKCGEQDLGFYEYDPDEKIDRLTICTDNVDMDDVDMVWEILSHESTHIMQACLGEDTIFIDEEYPGMRREVATYAPHYIEILGGYSSSAARSELEAFWMELQTPQEVIDYFSHFCI